MNCRRLGVVVVLVLWTVPSIAQPALDGDKKLIQGSWDWDPAVKHPVAHPPVHVERVVIQGDSLTFHYDLEGRKSFARALYILDPTASPKRIEFTFPEGRTKGVTLGLYEIDGDRLRICYKGPGEPRPKNFADRQSPNSTVVTTYVELVRTPAN